jgi:hypothetical protein
MSLRFFLKSSSYLLTHTSRKNAAIVTACTPKTFAISEIGAIHKERILSSMEMSSSLATISFIRGIIVE